VDKDTYDQTTYYRMSIAAYKTAWITVTYLVAQFVLFLHLWHGGRVGSVARLLSSALQLLLQMLRAVFRHAHPRRHCSIPLGVVAGIIK